MARKSRKNTEMTTQPLAKPTFRVGAYVRLSAVDKKQKGDSIENQQAIISAYIAENPGLELTEIYIDNGLTGQTFERPAFQQMLDDLDNGKINCCVSKDLSRLGRNAIDTGYYIEKYFPARNIRYIAINDNYDSADGNSGGIMVSLKNLINEAYALDIGRKIRATKQMNIRNGCFVGRFAPYGYLKSKSDSHKLIPDEYAAPIVRRIFEMALDGQGVRAIQNWLNNSSILPPRRYLHTVGIASEKEASGHIHWSKGVIYSILNNRVYVGDMVQGKGKTHCYVQKKIPQSEWVITENTHEGIISRDIFAKIQAMHSGNRKPAVKSKGENIFLRKIFCGHCGHTMRRVAYKQSHGFYCSTRNDYGKDDCKPVSIQESVLRKKLLEALSEQTPELIAIKPITAAKPLEYSKLQDVQAELVRTGGFLQSLYESLISGIITDAEYKELKQSYEAKIASLTKQEHQLRESLRFQELEAAKRNKAASSIGGILSDADLTAEVINTLVEKILIYEDKRMDFIFKFTDKIISKGGTDNE